MQHVPYRSGADLVGVSDASAFHHAFFHWTGSALTAYRSARAPRDPEGEGER